MINNGLIEKFKKSNADPATYSSTDENPNRIRQLNAANNLQVNTNGSRQPNLMPERNGGSAYTSSPGNDLLITKI